MIAKQFKRWDGTWEDTTWVVVFKLAELDQHVSELLAELPPNIACRLKVDVGGNVSWKWRSKCDCP